MTERKKWPIVLIIGLLLAAVAIIAVVALGASKEVTEKPTFQIGPNETDPAVWGKVYPRHYDSYLKNAEMSSTDFGGSKPISKLEKDPYLKILFAGNPFSIEYNEDRGHVYTVEDVKKIQRKKPSASCWTCKSSDIPGLIKRMGIKYYTASFDEVGKEVKHNIACLNCHDPKTMELKLTQPALISALERQGKDVSKLTRQEMRTYVCAQCHVEYYFKPGTLEVTFPWDKGMKIDNIEAYYNELKFKDWVHARSGAEMIKIQHPETEFFSNSTHAAAGVACADCHMPYMKEGTAKISSHWWTSPLKTIEQSCQTCHRQSAEQLKKRVLYTQERTAELLKVAGEANVAAIGAIEAAAKATGANQKLLAEARQLHRSAQMRWDWVAAENSTGFHNPQEALHTLGKSIDLARQAQLKAQQASGAAR